MHIVDMQYFKRCECFFIYSCEKNQNFFLSQQVLNFFWWKLNEMLLSYGLPSIRTLQNVIVHMWFRNFLKTRILSLHYNYNLSNSPINITSYKEHLQAFIIDRIIKNLNYKEFSIKKSW
jgi:hypothetical protein